MVLKADKRDLASRTLPNSQKSIRSLKSLLFTPGTKSDHFNRAAGVHADALIIDLEDAVAISGKREAREASLRYLELCSINLPSVLRINAPDTRVGLDDLQALLNSAADMAADLGAETAWEPLLWVRSRIVQAAGGRRCW